MYYIGLVFKDFVNFADFVKVSPDSIAWNIIQVIKGFKNRVIPKFTGLNYNNRDGMYFNEGISDSKFSEIKVVILDWFILQNFVNIVEPNLYLFYAHLIFIVLVSLTKVNHY